MILGCVIGLMSSDAADQLAMNDQGTLTVTSPQRIAPLSNEDSSVRRIQGVVREEVVREAQQVFQEGGTFYIYRDSNETLRGQGSVSGTVRYVKNPGASHEAVKIYSYIVTRGIYGEKRRFGVAGETTACADTSGELSLNFKGKFRSAISHTTTSVSGKAMLHVVLVPADADTRKFGLGCTIPAISNELLIPIDF
ncbi:MAG: hypothetical protein N2689_11470 [Verrucomicrobiae bacterium]|nr:hypothetical protein [Verrucomicrobiae bacterium]